MIIVCYSYKPRFINCCKQNYVSLTKTYLPDSKISNAAIRMLIDNSIKRQSIAFSLANQPLTIRYSLVVAMVAASSAATYHFPAFRGHAVFLLFSLAIILCVYWIGKNAGILATMLSFIAANYLIISNENRFLPYECVILNAGFIALSATAIAFSKSDVIGHRKTLAALAQQLNDLRTIIDATPAVISCLDTEFRYLNANATYEKWFGIPADQILGQKARNIIGESAWSIVRPYLERARSGEVVSFDQVIPYGDSTPRWVHGTYVPLLGTNGKVEAIVVHVIDIEERKQYEQKIAFLNQTLQDRIEEMHVIFDTVPIGLAIADGGVGNHIRGNPAIEQLFGLPKDSGLSTIHKSPAKYSFMHNDRELGTEELPLQRAMLGENVTNQVMDILRPDGKIITVLSNSSPLFGGDGKTRGAVGAFMDITALKRAEESLKKSQTQLRLFIEQAPVSIAMFDQEMNYMVTSHRWIEEFGLGCGTLAGFNFYQLNLNNTEKWKQIHQQALAGESLQNDGDLWILSDGSKQWLRWSAYPWTDQNGKIGGIIVTCEDITAAHQAEEKLRDTQARLALVVAEVNAGHWEWDLTTNVVFLSPEYKRQIGYEDHELESRYDEWESRLHPDDCKGTLAALEACINNLQPDFELRFRLRHKDGSYRWIHSRAGLLRDKKGRPYRMLGINLDVTDYMKTKELNERREKMEQSFRFYVASQTAAAIAHELNQPLTAISYYADTAVELLQGHGGDPKKPLQIIEKCGEQALRAGGVIKQLLAILHKGETLVDPLDINHSILEALNLINTDERFKDIKCKLELDPGLPLVRANSLQIQKVLVNLISNSLESLSSVAVADETITIKTGKCNGNELMVQVTVRDNGPGISDKAMLQDMFQPFYTTKSDGLGMGLAISKALIEAHGGHIWAEQNEPVGLSVHLTLPQIV